MIGTEYIHQPVIAAAEFFPMIGDVGQPVGRLAAAFDDDPVLVMTELGGLEPDRPILLVNQAAVPQCGDHIVDQPVFIQAVLIIVAVKDNAEPLQRLINVGENSPFRRLLERFDVGHVLQRIPIFAHKFPGNVKNILALVAVLGEGVG